MMTVVVLLLILITPITALAQTSVNYTFEDGQRRGTPTSMQVPPQVLSEGSNQFLRITGSTGDCQSIPGHLCPPRNRSTVRFTSLHSSMPVITSENMRQTYRASLRFRDASGDDGVVFSLYQGAPGGEKGGYGSLNDNGPVVRLYRGGGKVYFRSEYNSERSVQQVSRAVSAGSWHTYMVVAVWSHDPSVGRLDYYMDGSLIMRVSGRDVNLGPSSNRIPEMKLGLYGDYATGVVDVDNIYAGPTGGSVPDDPPPHMLPPAPLPPPVVKLPPPINFRVVTKP